MERKEIMIKAIFFDIDGTLIPHGKDKMPESTLKTLHHLRKKGIKLFIATGRPPVSIEHVQKMFDFDGFLTANGQYCFNKDELIYERYIPSESIKELIPYVEEKKLKVLYATLSNCYKTKYVDHPFEDEKEIVQYDSLLKENIVQIMAYINKEDDQEFLSHLPECKSVRWCSLFADIIPCLGGKDKGIDKMIDYYHIHLDEVLVFGDGENDITMLEHVPHSVAMGNANDDVKKHAFYVTSDIEDDGIYNACHYFGLI